MPTLRFSVGAAEPVTITSLRFTALTRNVTSSVTEPPSVTVTDNVVGEYPMRRTTIEREPLGTPTMRYSPFTPLIAPTRVPATLNCASASPRPFAASVTLPRTVPDTLWASSSAGSPIIASASAITPRHTC